MAPTSSRGELRRNPRANVMDVPAQSHACHSHAIIPRAPTKTTRECNGLLGRDHAGFRPAPRRALSQNTGVRTRTAPRVVLCSSRHSPTVGRCVSLIPSNPCTSASNAAGKIGSVWLRVRTRVVYRGTSLIRNTPLLGPYRSTIPRVLWWSVRGGAYRGTSLTKTKICPYRRPIPRVLGGS